MASPTWRPPFLPQTFIYRFLTDVLSNVEPQGFKAAALKRTLFTLDDIPEGLRDIVAAMCTLFLFYLQIGYLKEQDVYLPALDEVALMEEETRLLNAQLGIFVLGKSDNMIDKLMRDNQSRWRANGWDERVIAALPFLPSAVHHDETGEHITPGSYGCDYHGRHFRQQCRFLGGHLDDTGHEIPNYALPLTDGLEFTEHWIWDAKEGLIRTWNHDTGIKKLEDLPGVPILEKFGLLTGRFQALDLIPWNGKIYEEPNPQLIEQGRDNGFPDYVLEANTFVVARDAYLQADWGGEGPQWDPKAFQLSVFLAARGRWDTRMAAIDRRYRDGEIDFDGLRRAQHEAAIQMAGDEAYT